MAIVSTNATYTFTVTSDRILTAVFEKIPVYTITATIDPSGGGTVTGAGQYQEGDTVTLVAAPGDGYEFSGWQEGGQTISMSTTYTFTATADRTLTAAFAVARRLPAGYTELEYIESTNGNCIIDTGQKLEPNIDTVIDFEPLSAPTKTDAMIVWNNYSGVWYSSEWLNYGSLVGVVGSITSNNSGWKTINSNTTPRRMIVEMDNNTGVIKADGTAIAFTSKGVYSNASPNVFLLGTPTKTATLKARLYSCKIHLGSSAARDFVPCKNPSGVVGLYDLVTKVFFKSTTSTEFTAGPAV